MRRSWRAAVLAAAVAAGAAGTAALAGGGDGPEVKVGGDAWFRFLFFATFEGACEDALPKEAVKAILEGEDGKAAYRNFVYGCPVCGPVQNGLVAYAMRREFSKSYKGDPFTDEFSPSPVADLAEKVRSPVPEERGAALHDLVKRWVERRMDRLRLDEEERAAWRLAMARGRKEGMGVLPSSKGFEFKSCPSCDGASGNDDLWK